MSVGGGDDEDKSDGSPVELMETDVPVEQRVTDPEQGVIDKITQEADMCRIQGRSQGRYIHMVGTKSSARAKIIV